MRPEVAAWRKSGSHLAAVSFGSIGFPDGSAFGIARLSSSTDMSLWLLTRQCGAAPVQPSLPRSQTGQA